MENTVHSEDNLRLRSLSNDSQSIMSIFMCVCAPLCPPPSEKILN